ncbi:hypothetical protein C7477_11676 [Phyllobacterium leguminum]|uniref:Uncharacterized protein n=2 Tax=Phyllobacterium leguminum TaxID=314237 RepID=A0A318SYH9_9HYPH|nr:DUF6516 family protein [Phyllobacterium leguminum]PYE87117.1 hypothetical protein C7477_11676 [Phyllobacterium leguminum]
MKAQKLFHEKRILGDGSIVEMVIWELPYPVPGSTHSYKYRLFFGRDGKRIVGFDNERGKGDHCHLDGIERSYVFISVDQLKDDFLAEVGRRLNQ